MQGTTIAVDLAKSVFEIAVSHRPGKIAERHRLNRRRFERFLALQAPATIVMEACGTAHYWGRRAQAGGHRVRLLPARDVARYVKGNKTDRSDVKGILEADRNEDVRPVPIKSVEQQALMSLHRMRSTWVATRTSRLNTLRGLLRELGITIPVGARRVVPAVWSLVSDAESGVPDTLRPVLAEAAREVTELEQRIHEVEAQLEALARKSPVIRRLRTIPGVGLLTATAVVASMGDLERFSTARHFSSSLGLTPRESSSGQIRRLGRITKRGDAYVRTLLIHGARSVLHHAKRRECPDRLRRWALEREGALGHNKAAVALANKLARIVWAISVHEDDYRSAP
ncbi:MAG: IS110 family transposase [Myxococcales bacterium]|nr:IS110 family transposase [Myxococcales bacterium]